MLQAALHPVSTLSAHDDPQPKEPVLRLPIAQSMASVLTTIFEHMDDLKESTTNRVLRLLPAHYHQFGSYVTKMSDRDGEVYHISDPKSIQS